MIRLPSRATARLAQSSLAPARTITARRFLTTAPPHLRSRSWKNSAARWGIAISGIYYYTTSPIFAEEPSNNLLNPNLDKLDEEAVGTSLEALTSRSRHQQSKESSVLASAASAASAASTSSASTTAAEPATAQDLSEEADQQGAFNPETGEINWDCPCLGGMAHGPCGPQFREAFSCFVYSNEEPKGVDCIEKFQGMQECFKEHPEVYKGELDDEDDDEGEYDEAMAAEKEELVREIKERRERAGIEADGTPRKRLLEESTGTVKEPQPTPKPQSRKAGPSSNTSDGSASLTPGSEAKLSTESKPANPSDIPSGQSSLQSTKPTPPPANPTSIEGQDLIPKAAHDATNAVTPDHNKSKP